MPLEKVNEIT